MSLDSKGLGSLQGGQDRYSRHTLLLQLITAKYKEELLMTTLVL